MFAPRSQALLVDWTNGTSWKKGNVRWDVEDVFVEVAEQLNKDGRRDHIPAYWRDCITRDLIGSVGT